jgi:hypothetical protein
MNSRGPIRDDYVVWSTVFLIQLPVDEEIELAAEAVSDRGSRFGIGAAVNCMIVKYVVVYSLE